MNPRPVSRVVRQNSAGVGLCYPTLAKLGWGTPFLWWMKAVKSNRRSLDSLRRASVAQDDNVWLNVRMAGVGLCYPTLAATTKARQGWGTPWSCRGKFAKSNRRSFDSLRCASVAQDDSCELRVCAIPP